MLGKLSKVISLAVFSFAIVFGLSSGSASATELLGAGATFPQPLYSKMFDAYHQQYGVKINYQGIGSGGGINQLTRKTVDFGGTDAFMTEKQLSDAGAQVLHIPTSLGAVVVTYNLPGNPKLNFTPEVVAEMFLGKIKRWNDPRIASANPGTNLPNLPVTVVRRADSSGTTFIFTEYLTKVSAEWKDALGTGTSVNWPAGSIGQRGNPGVAGYVKQTPGSIGYVELIYATHNNMPYGNIRNKAGKFIEPTVTSVSAAAKIRIPDDTNVSLTNTEAPDGYPISGFTWLIFYKEQNYGKRSKDRAEALAKLLWWTANDGQVHVEPLQYSPLSKEAVAKANAIIKSMTYNGVPLIK